MTPHMRQLRTKSTSLNNTRLLDQVLERGELYRRDPHKLFPWLLRPCRVKVLLVTDGGLDFSPRDFGLSTFVSVLQQAARHYVEFELTLAHLQEGVPDDAVMQGAPGIARSIKGFRFDEPTHFTPTMYDQVWLFGIETNFHSPAYQHRSAAQSPYPADRLSDAELRNLSEFMNQGGGLFATGDHGLLGRCLCGSVSRVRSMRLWASTSGDPAIDEVSMSGLRRNDTNRIGRDAGTQFDDQSDDVPQEIQPTLYRRQISPFFVARYPHPLLCGPEGIINVLPDHPHEGECVVPADLSQTYPIDGSPEYPPATVGGGAVAPEIIAQSSVPAGNDSAGTKQATQAHSFGAICAYDGHRAGVGRVVTDATWHHFININLIGVAGLPDDSVKGRGFLASPEGEAHFENIKTYYRNIAVWISPASSHRCFRRKLLWGLLYQHRVMEAVLTTPELSLQRANVSLLYEIGVHARDVLGWAASRCQTEQLIIDLVWPTVPELIPELDPWQPPIPEPDPPPLPWVDPTPLLSIALGGALVALREVFPFPAVEITDAVDQQGDEVIARGVTVALREGLRSLDATLNRFVRLAATSSQ
jgi:hypothetical protein